MYQKIDVNRGVNGLRKIRIYGKGTFERVEMDWGEFILKVKETNISHSRDKIEESVYWTLPITFISVDFPAPELPIMAITEPGLTVP